MKTIPVWPRDDGIRAHVRHPSGRRFDLYPEGTHWPNDQFTARRVADGGILLEDPRQRRADRPQERPGGQGADHDPVLADQPVHPADEEARPSNQSSRR